MKDGKDSEDFRTYRGYQLIDRQSGRMTSAMEDYLEMIYRDCKENGYSRVGRLSGLLHVKPSSASKMIFRLSDQGYVQYDRYEIIRLTSAGEKAGGLLLHRHNVIENFLKIIGSENALRETELIEHSLSLSTVRCLQMLVQFLRRSEQSEQEFREFRRK